MGEENLQKTIKEYYNQWHLKHPTDRYFIHIAPLVSGMDLKWFHHYWINTTKTIDYGIKNVQYDETSTTITLANNGQVPMPIDFGVMLKDKSIVNYQIPLNLTRVFKTKDINGNFTSLPIWPWTQREYTFTIPYTKNQLSVLGIDFTQRMADVNQADNIVEVK